MSERSETVSLESAVLAQAEESMAVDILLRALIATHPNPPLLKQAIERIAEGTENQTVEHAFSTGRKPDIPRKVNEGTQKHVRRWLDILEPPHG